MFEWFFNDSYLIFILFVFGTIIGSFLNVVIFRFNTGQKIANDRSKCLNCGSRLQWFNLIPIFSWIFQKGRCFNCKSKISFQYPLVEFFSGLLFVLVFFQGSGIEILGLNLIFKFISLIIVCLLLIIFVYDLRHKIIPDEFSFGFAGLGFIYQVLYSWQIFGWHNSMFYFNIFAGLILALPFYLLWQFSKGQWIGLGDAKLVLGIGFWLGLIYGASAIILAFYIGALFSIVLVLIQRLIHLKQNITMKTEIPFGPFLILATILVFLWQIDIFGLSFILIPYDF